MAEKLLGKIASAEFGVVDAYPFLFGLKLHFQMGSSAIGDGGKHMVNIEYHNTAVAERSLAEMFRFCKKTLDDAKVSSVSGLVGKPVEVTLNDGVFSSFRILTEVL